MTAHDAIVAMLKDLVTGMETSPTSPLNRLMLDAVQPVMRQIRIEQSYDDEVMALLDRIENLTMENDQ